MQSNSGRKAWDERAPHSRSGVDGDGQARRRHVQPGAVDGRDPGVILHARVEGAHGVADPGGWRVDVGAALLRKLKGCSRIMSGSIPSFPQTGSSANRPSERPDPLTPPHRFSSPTLIRSVRFCATLTAPAAAVPFTIRLLAVPFPPLPPPAPAPRLLLPLTAAAAPLSSASPRSLPLAPKLKNWT